MEINQTKKELWEKTIKNYSNTYLGNLEVINEINALLNKKISVAIIQNQEEVCF